LKFPEIINGCPAGFGVFTDEDLYRESIRTAVK
jgi:hypothetical protein